MSEPTRRCRRASRVDRTTRRRSRARARFSGSSKRRVNQPLLVALLTARAHRRRASGRSSGCRSTRIPTCRRRAWRSSTQWPGHAAEEVERLITVPIETEMNGLPNLVVMRSISLYGLSSVRVTFADGTDIYFARQQVFERLARRRRCRTA